MGFVFDEERHLYLKDGVVVPGVTSFLASVNMIPSCSWYKPEHAERGKAVHDCIFLHIHNDLDEDSIHPIVKPYFDGFKKFMIESRFIPLVAICEKPMMSEKYWFGGRPDLVGLLNGRLAVIDAKTGDAQLYAEFQTAAYEIIIRENMPDFVRASLVDKSVLVQSNQEAERFSLRLYPDGRYKLHHWTDYRNRMEVLSGLNVYRAITRKRKLEAK
jgi:hypothetical protein